MRMTMTRRLARRSREDEPPHLRVVIFKYLQWRGFLSGGTEMCDVQVVVRARGLLRCEEILFCEHERRVNRLD